MQRLRLYDCRLSRLPSLVGLCQDNIPGIAGYVNGAVRRLVMAKEAGDEGWWGTWAEVAFTVSRTTPYWTAPREVARLEGVNVCERPIPVNNQFLEYLQFGNGRLPKTFRRTCSTPRLTEAYTRNNVPTFIDLSNPPQSIIVSPMNSADAGKRVFLQGLDSSGNTIYTIDGNNNVQGQFVTLANPFVKAPQNFNLITGVQKDITLGPVNIYQMDPTTGTQILLLTMQPGEQTASYRRYYFDNLPLTCCIPNPAQPQAQTLTLTGLVKLDIIPVTGDTDYVLLTNLEAIIEECRSIRYSEMDNPNANISESKSAHINAIGLLNGELAHFLGIDEPAIMWRPFGSARLRNQRIGTMV